MPVLPGAEPFSADGGPTGALLIHGFTGTPQSMRGWAEHLAAAGLAVELPRLPGHGTTWQEMNTTRWTDWYAEADRAFAALQARCEEVFVMGLSMGGTLAIRLAERHGAQVAGLVVVNPSLTTTDRRALLLPILSRFVASFPPIANDIARDGVTELAYDRLPLRAAASLARLWRVTRANLESVVCPLLVFRSEQDHVVEAVNTRILLSGVSSDFTEEQVLPRSYHVATLDYDAGRIFEGSLAFVRRNSRLAPG